MTTKCFFAALVCCFGLGFASEASANSWRVNYDKRANADFQDLNAAMSDERVADGDTLYMDKGCTISSQQYITKAVTVIGPGYFIGENDADEAYISNTIIFSVEGAKITGLHTSTIELQTSNVVIERCRITGDINAKSGYVSDNIAIRSCFILGNIVGRYYSFGWEITNNIINTRETKQYCIYGLSQAVIDHNIIVGKYYKYFENAIYCVEGSTITNNIIDGRDSYYSTPDRTISNFGLGSNNIISHNILSNPSAVSVYPNNKYNVQLTNVCTYQDSWEREAYFQLIEDSPAKGYAEDGSDCGPYAGAYPYVLCGYPLYVPRFESITVPSQPDESGNLKIQMVIKNQNK
jgi:hypothetical protein